MSDFTFDGFEPANTTPVPDVLFDVLLSELNESELKVLLYIIRRTSGFKKATDAISLNQFQKGIKKRATGEILDRGCGVKDRATIVKALASLEKKGCIQADKTKDPQGDKATSVYRIRFRTGVVGKTNHPTDIGSGQNQPPWFAKPTTGSGQNQLGVVGDSNPQETVIQLDSKQETGLQESTIPRVEQSDDSDSTIVSPHTPALSQSEIAEIHEQVAELQEVVRRINGELPAPSQVSDEMVYTNSLDEHGQVYSAGAARQLSTVAVSSPQQRAKVEPAKRSQSKKSKPVETAAPPAVPAMPSPDAEWKTTTCLQLFNYWRTKPLIGTYKNSQASTCAKGLALNYTREQVEGVRNYMVNDDPYWSQQPERVDVCSVAEHIHEMLAKIARGGGKPKKTTPPPSNIEQEMEASRRAMREINEKEKARTGR